MDVMRWDGKGTVTATVAGRDYRMSYAEWDQLLKWWNHGRAIRRAVAINHAQRIQREARTDQSARRSLPRR